MPKEKFSGYKLQDKQKASMGSITTLNIPLFRFENKECFVKRLILSSSDLVHDVWRVLVHGSLPDPEVRGV